MVECAEVGVFQCDEEGHCVFANDRVYKIIGLSRSKILGVEYFIPSDILKSKKTHVFERRFGRNTWGQIRLQYLKQKFWVGTLIDISEQKAYAEWMINELEDEKKRLARELHDGVIQLLASAHFRVEGLRDELKSVPDLMKQDVEKAHLALGRAIEEVRRISHRLRPSLLDDLGLESAIRSFCMDFAERLKVELSLELDQLERKYEDSVELGIFRILQEVLRNVEKYAKASKIHVALMEKVDYLHFVIRDNGCGFDPKVARESGIGLVHIRERVGAMGGTLRLKSRLNVGTEVDIRISYASKGDSK